MNTRILFLAWQEPKSRQWFPVGRLDAEEDSYRFRYTRGAERAQGKASFPLSAEFPYIEKDYRAKNLFATFGNRVMARSRPDRADHLRNLGLEENADPVEILSVNGGRRVTDAYQVFPKLSKGEEGKFTCRFFLHGWRYMPDAARERIDKLKEWEKLLVAIKLKNPATGLAAQIQTEDYHMIGWTPRWLMPDVVAAARETGECAACVVRVNPLPPPSPQRVLIEMTGRWDKHEPMTGEDFVPLVGD